MLIAGCDPGLAGALSPRSRGDAGRCDDWPTLTVGKGSGGKRREISPQMLAAEVGRVVGGSQVAMVYIERVSAMPGQGVTGMFQFGRSLGIAEGVVAVLGWPIKYVSHRNGLPVVNGTLTDADFLGCQMDPGRSDTVAPRHVLWLRRRGGRELVRGAPPCRLW